MKDQLVALISRSLGAEVEFALEPPPDPALGHFATNAALKAAPVLKKAPMEIANELAAALRGRADLIAAADVAAPGFINIRIADAALAKQFAAIRKAGAKWGMPAKKTRETAIVEHSDVNVAKRMHVGHLRGTIIGAALSNVLEFLGYKTIRWNYIGDWGTQFGKLIAAYKRWGSKRELDNAPIETLHALYVHFHDELKTDSTLETAGREEFRKLESGDRANRALWQWFRKESLKDFNRIYKTLDVSFTVTIGESFFEKDLAPIVAQLAKQGIAQASEGALIVPQSKTGFPDALVQKSDGASLYLTRDLANIRYRLNHYHPKRIIYVVGNEQSLHFNQVFSIAKLMGMDLDGVSHVKYGLVLGEDMKKLSTRAGKVVLLEDVIAEAIERAGKVVGEKRPDLSKSERVKIANVVGIAALKYNDLSQNRVSDIAFDWDKMLSFEGNSAPYLMYTYARLKSILRKAKPGKLDAKAFERADLDLAFILSRFPDVILRVAQDYFPNRLADYLYQLAGSANTFYHSQPVLKAEPKALRDARLHLIGAVAQTLKTGLGLLGIPVLEKM